MFDPELHVVCFFPSTTRKTFSQLSFQKRGKRDFQALFIEFGWGEANRMVHLCRQKFSRKFWRLALAMPQCIRVRNLGRVSFQSFQSDCNVFALEQHFMYENLSFTSLRLSNIHACVLRQAGSYGPVWFKHTVL